MTKIKICGIRTIEDISIINDFKPEYAGFVLAQSKRRVSTTQLADLITNLDSSIIPVGVFVNESYDKILEALETGIQIIQLHGDEDQNYINELCQKLREAKNINNFSVWKAIRINSEQSEKYNQDIANTMNQNLTDTLNQNVPDQMNQHVPNIINQNFVNNFNEVNLGVDAYLLDKYSKDNYGGTGEKFNWNLFGGFNSPKPLILAGGLNENNVLEGIEIVKPYCVDVSSGVEIDGKKNRKKIESFVNKIRNS